MRGDAGMNVDYSLYLVTDRGVLRAPPLERAVEQAVLGGCTMVQLREKTLPTRAFYELALPGGMLLGVSAATVEEALRAQESGADYLGVGAIYPTDTKTDARPVDLAELRRIRQAVRLPIVAIGGLSLANAATVLKTGVDGLAVVSAVLARPDVRAAAAALRRVILEERGRQDAETTLPGGDL